MIVIVPMAGRGSRFSDRGWQTPKPLISIAGKPMVSWAVDSLKNLDIDMIIFVVLAEHDDRFQVSSQLQTLTDCPTEVIIINNVTEGQLCTVMTARELINVEEDLLIASSDTYVESDLAAHIKDKDSNCAGIISAANLPGERWSFARTNDCGIVVEVAEKKRISDFASTGLYYFSSGRQFVSAADEIILQGKKTRGEYYIIPVYQEYIANGWPVSLSVAERVWDMGNPESLSIFERHLHGV